MQAIHAVPSSVCQSEQGRVPRYEAGDETRLMSEAVAPRCSRLMGSQILGQMSGVFGQEVRVKELEEKLRATHSSMIIALNQMLDLKDLNTGYHSTRLAEWALRVAQELRLEQSWMGDIEAAALLHDIGKVGVPDSILRKPAKLTDEEYALMKKHPEYGWAIVRLFPDFERAGLYVLHHHESYDGKGYPGGLKDVEIPIGARIVSVIDAFDAMLSSRPYRQGLPFEEAIRRLIQGSGTQFDPEVVRCFIRIAQDEVPDVYAATGTTQKVVL